MNHFGDFAKKEDIRLAGDKMPISNIFGKVIEVQAFRILNSKAVKDKKCIQIQFLMEGKLYVTFTNSWVIERQLNEYKDKIPFDCKIEKAGSYYTFVPSGNETGETEDEK